MIRVLCTAIVAPAFVGMGACAQTPAQRAEADMASVRQETNAATLVERGRGFASVGDHTRAEEYLAAALDAGANPRDVLPLLMNVCVQTGRYRSAIQHGENQLRKHPNDLRTRVMVGALYVAINDGKHARELLEQVVSIPEDVVNRADADSRSRAPSTFLPMPAPSSAPAADATDADGGARVAVGPVPVTMPAVTGSVAAAAPGAPSTPTAASTPTAPPLPIRTSHIAHPEPLFAQAHYLLAVVARDTDSDVVAADRHFREYLRIEPNGSHAEEAKASLLKRLP